ncbi:unnamed protein product, partial [Nesidiocoris tenuis]
MDCSDDYGREDLLETGDDGSSAFKKPVISHAAIRKNILQTHMKKNMGFVQGGILTTVSSSESGSEKPADASRAEPPEKKASSQVPPSLKYDEPDWAGIPEDNYFLEVGHMIKIGCSTRFFILQGPDEDAEEESSLTFSELKKKREEELEARKLLEEKAKEEEELEKKRQEQLLEEKGISWGM